MSQLLTDNQLPPSTEFLARLEPSGLDDMPQWRAESMRKASAEMGYDRSAGPRAWVRVNLDREGATHGGDFISRRAILKNCPFPSGDTVRLWLDHVGVDAEPVVNAGSVPIDQMWPVENNGRFITLEEYCELVCGQAQASVSSDRLSLAAWGIVDFAAISKSPETARDLLEAGALYVRVARQPVEWDFVSGTCGDNGQEGQAPTSTQGLGGGLQAFWNASKDLHNPPVLRRLIQIQYASDRRSMGVGEMAGMDSSTTSMHRIHGEAGLRVLLQIEQAQLIARAVAAGSTHQRSFTDRHADVCKAVAVLSSLA